MNIDWIDQFLKESIFEAPYEVEKDSEYEKTLERIMTDYIGQIKNADIDSKFIQEIEDFEMLILKAIEAWYEGEPWAAYHLINECVDEMLKGGICTCKLNECPAILRYKHAAKISEVQFFRARITDEYGYFEAKDMFHIPLDKRAKFFVRAI